MYTHVHKEKGITLLIAMVITAAILLISTGIVVLSVREAQLSSIARESQKAFYAADSGIECALYSDVKQHMFDFIGGGGGGPVINCGGSDISVVAASTVYSFTLNNADGSYALVTVTKDSGKTTIESRGRNKLSGRDVVERAIRVSYL